MGETPDQIRRKIALTRERLTETLAALRQRADLRARLSVWLRGWFEEIAQRVRWLRSG
jgi:Protein of unknown function (DUF3618)